MRENINKVIQAFKLYQSSKKCFVALRFVLPVNTPINESKRYIGIVPHTYKIIVPSNALKKLTSTHTQIKKHNTRKCHNSIILFSSFIVVYVYYKIKILFHFVKNFLTFKEEIICKTL